MEGEKVNTVEGSGEKVKSQRHIYEKAMMKLITSCANLNINLKMMFLT